MSKVSFVESFYIQVIYFGSDRLYHVISLFRFLETHLKLPLNDDLIHFKFQQRADMYGHFRLPTMFFTGVTFGLTWQNPHDLYVSSSCYSIV